MIFVQDRRNDYKNQQKKLFIAIVGSFCVILAVFIFGLPLLVNFSLFVDSIRGKSPSNQSKSFVLPPVLDPLTVATNSSALTISGQATPRSTLILYINDVDAKKITIQDDGKFQTTLLGKSGENTISGKTMENNGLLSELSNTVSTMIINKPPLLEITSPDDFSTFPYDINSVNVEGKIDIGNTILVNGRVVIVQSDGTFGTRVTLNEGENIILIETKDVAGNTSTAERHVTYQK